MTDREYDQIELLAKKAGRPLSTCPTCFARPITIDENTYGWESGTYRYKGEEYPCDCATQRALYRAYLLANIPEEYMRLNWNDYSGDPSVLEPVATFLEKWKYFRNVGMGLLIASENLGVGKTFTATHVGKELTKRGVRVYFAPFLEIINVYTRDDKQELDERYRNTQVLILDELMRPIGNQKDFFAMEFERLIRHRTSHNLPTIITTNMESDELHETFPRVYSLLEPKVWPIILRGDDARRKIIADENLELILNEEVRPIT